MKRTYPQLILILFLITQGLTPIKGLSGTLVSGPMLGYAEHREAQIWLEVSPDSKLLEVEYLPASGKGQKKKITTDIQGSSFAIPLKITFPLLEMNTTYAYEIFLDGKKQEFPFPTRFSTRALWEHRTDSPDFTFLFGSCVYLNDSLYDRPGKPYGQSDSILAAMEKTPSDFILWGGDNTYLREADYSSESGIRYRYSKNFSHPLLRPLRASRCNFAIWDDHDFGPNDSGKDFPLKDLTQNVFKEYWCSPAFGGADGGTYQLRHWSDADFFLLDDRFFRSACESETEKSLPCDFLGSTQMEWLINGLSRSSAKIKFIVCGSQVLNPLNNGECFRLYKKEYGELMQFISKSGLPGIVFLSGDRHFSEIIKDSTTAAYPLYDITSSPITSGVFRVEKSAEKNNPFRIPGSLFVENNYAAISVSGKRDERVIRVSWHDAKGVRKYFYDIPVKALQKTTGAK